MSTINELKAMASSKLGFARTNNFLIELPSLRAASGKRNFGLGGVVGSLAGAVTDNLTAFIPSVPGLTADRTPNSRELNTLCKGASLPGKQILTVERRIGMTNETVAYGYAVAPINLSFNMLNDYSVKTYFDEWLDLILQDGYSADGKKTAQIVRYKENYALPVKIHQLRKPQVGFSANLGPISANIGLGGGSVYTVELYEAFPTTINEITFSNDLDGIVELSVTLNFTNWKRARPSQNFINTSIGI